MSMYSKLWHCRFVGRIFKHFFFSTGAYGYPDTQLISYAEMANAANFVAEGLSSAAMEIGVDPIPCIADGDTG